MKSILLLLFSFFALHASAQINMIAHYPFQTDGIDLIDGDEAIIENAPFLNGGIYSNGLYSGTNDNGSHIRIQNLEEWTLDHFTVVLDFRIDSLPDFNKPIIVFGSSWRWLFLEVTNAGELYLITNDGTSPQNTGITVPTDQWNSMVVGYSNQVVSVTLNGNAPFAYNVVLETNNNHNLTNEHGGDGRSFKGYWRSLMVINGDFTGIQENSADVVELYPVPCSHTLTVEGLKLGTNWEVTTLNGQVVQEGIAKAGISSIDVSELTPGAYVLRSELGNRMVAEQFVVEEK